jgi:hypothetical protein
VGLGQIGRVGNANHTFRRIVAKIPGRQCHGRDNRLQMARRYSDDQPLHLAGCHLRDLVSHRVDVPVRLERRPRAKQTKHIFDKRPEIRAQDGQQYPLRRGVFGEGRTNGDVHDPPCFFFCSARKWECRSSAYFLSASDIGLDFLLSAGSGGCFASG